MSAMFQRLGPRLILSIATFLLVLAASTALLVAAGFRNTQQRAVISSADGLEAQGREALIEMTRREASLMGSELQRSAYAGQQMAAMMVSLANRSRTDTTTRLEQLVEGPHGERYNADPNRKSDILLYSYIDVQEQTERDLRDSAVLESLFPAVLQYNRDVTAAYYINTQGMTRYAPVINLHNQVSHDFDVLGQPFYALATPPLNPTRVTVWTPPYIDPAGRGLMVTASTPIYDGIRFRGVIGLDVTLSNLIYRLEMLRTTSSGYSFLVDDQGRLVAAPPHALHDLIGPEAAQSTTVTSTVGIDLNTAAAPDLRSVLNVIRAGQHGATRIELGGRPVFIAYAPLPGIGWGLAVVAPVSEVTAQSTDVAAAIRAGTDETIRTTLLLMAGFFLAAIAGTTLLSRRLTRPIAALVYGTREVAAGNLSVRLDVKSDGELHELADSFNQMAGDLEIARDRLQSLNQGLEQMVEQRTAQLAEATAVAQEARAIAEQASRLKSQFLASMSHELRTPLNSIINFTRILLAGMRGPITPQQADYLERVYESSEHLLGLINDILDLSKIEAGRMVLYPEPLQIAELIETTAASSAALAREKGIEFFTELDPDLPVVEADRTRIRQVLLNLFSNAVKFTDQGSVVVRAFRQDDELWVCVKDTGIGIASDQLVTIFEEFRQVDTSPRRHEGTGLGLAICRRLIEMHGGRIWAESKPGVGSSFIFTLPLTLVVPTEPQLVAGQRTLRPPRTGPAVLVIDDDPSGLETLASALRLEGYAVYGLSDGKRALSEAHKVRPAVILLDVLMLDRNGWDVLTELKADPYLRSTPVVLYGLAEERQSVAFLGAAGYLVKPIDGPQLRRAVSGSAGYAAHVLLIDDDPASVEQVRHLLQEVGRYTIKTVSDARAAFESVAAEQPDVILLGLTMAESDGFELLQRLQQSEETVDLPIIILLPVDLTPDEHLLLDRRFRALLDTSAVPIDTLLRRIGALLKPALQTGGA